MSKGSDMGLSPERNQVKEVKKKKTTFLKEASLSAINRTAEKRFILNWKLET